MRWGLPDTRPNVIIPSAPVMGAAGLGVCVMLATGAVADTFHIKPTAILEQIFTDNVRASSSDRDADGATILTTRIEATLQTSRLNAASNVDLFYHEFWAANDLDSFNGSGIVLGRLEVLKDHFYIDGLADRREVFLSPQNQSAANLTTGQNLIQQTGYDVSPFVKLEVVGLADLLVRGRYARVVFDEPVVGVAATLLDDITIKQASGKITTGDRSSFYELLGTAEYVDADTGFEQRNALGGAIIKVTNHLQAIGRYGYERIFDPSFAEIKGPIWSVGGRFDMGERSFIHVEYGHRFNDVSWLGDMNLVVSPYVTLSGGYTDSLSPIQFTLTRSLEDLLNQDGTFNISVPAGPNLPNPLLLDEIVRDKNLRAAVTLTNDLRSYALRFDHFDREFPALLDTERFYAVSLSVTEQLSRRMQYFVNLQFEDNYDVLTGGTPTQAYRTDFSVVYKFSDDYVLAGAYTWQLDTAPNDVDTYQNVLRFSVSRAL